MRLARSTLPSLPSLCAALGLLACGGEGEAPSDSGQSASTGRDQAAESGPGATGGGALGDDPFAGPDLGARLGEGGACTSSVAAATFTSAVCSCEDINVAGYVRTRSFRSDAGPDAPEELGGSVGINGDYASAGFADIGGSLAVAGARDIAFGGYLEIGEDVRTNPRFDVAGYANVGRDAFLASDARVLGRFAVGRDLYLETGAGIRGIALVDVGGERRNQAVEIADPCACAPEQIMNVAALVDAAALDNDNAEIGLDPDEPSGVVGIGAELRLPSGRYYIRQLGVLGSLTLHVTDHVALFVEDDLIATGLFRVELEPDAELDVFVRDNLVITGAALFGDPARPSATRIYVGGTGDVAIAGASAFVGNLYAPTANILVGGFGKIYGSLFGKNVDAAGFLDLGYDSSILEPGDGCPPLEPGDVPYLR